MTVMVRASQWLWKCPETHARVLRRDECAVLDVQYMGQMSGTAEEVEYFDKMCTQGRDIRRGVYCTERETVGAGLPRPSDLCMNSPGSVLR